MSQSNPLSVWRAQDLWCETPDRALVRALTLEARAGQALALIGPNGAGKSTLLSALSGLRAPTRGAIWARDAPLSGAAPAQIARWRAHLSQDQHVAFGFGALELVLMARHAWRGRWGWPSAGERAQALDAMAQLEVDHLAARPVTALSGGELRRVLLARVIASGAPWWMLDEPTAGLDLKHQARALSRARQHCDAGGAVIAVMHDLGLVERYFDQVAMLRDGQLIAHGPVAEVMTRARLEALFEVTLTEAHASDGARLWGAARDKTLPSWTS